MSYLTAYRRKLLVLGFELKLVFKISSNVTTFYYKNRLLMVYEQNISRSQWKEIVRGVDRKLGKSLIKWSETYFIYEIWLAKCFFKSSILTLEANEKKLFEE